MRKIKFVLAVLIFTAICSASLFAGGYKKKGVVFENRYVTNLDNGVKTDLYYNFETGEYYLEFKCKDTKFTEYYINGKLVRHGQITSLESDGHYTNYTLKDECVTVHIPDDQAWNSKEAEENAIQDGWDMFYEVIDWARSIIYDNNPGIEFEFQDWEDDD